MERLALLNVLLFAVFFNAHSQGCSGSAGPSTGNQFSTLSLSGSFFSWSNPSGAQTSDASYATGSYTLGVLASAYSDYLVVNNFGFNIPSSATICEIIVDIQRNTTGLGLGNSAQDKSVRLLKNGTLTGNDQASGSAWPSTDGTATYGNSISTGLWGTSWTPADVNNSNFGVAVSALLNSGVIGVGMTAQINQVRVTILYNNIVLGLELQQFTATKTTSGNLLEWTAANTNGPTGSFALFRSADTHDWQTLTTVSASTTINQSSFPVTLSNSAASSYSFTDTKPLPGVNYYRLRMDDGSGTPQYSPIASVEDDAVISPVRCWPNPFLDRICVSTSRPMAKLVLKDMQGRTMMTAAPPSGTTEYQMSTPGLPPGIYVLDIDGHLQKLVKVQN